MKHIKSFDSDGDLEKIKDEAFLLGYKFFLKHVKKAFEHYGFTFKHVRDSKSMVDYSHVLVNDIPMKIPKDRVSAFSFSYIAFDIESMENMPDLINIIKPSKGSREPSFGTVKEVVQYFRDNSIRINSNSKLKPIIKSGLFESVDEINYNSNGLLKAFKQEAEAAAIEIFVQKIKECFIEEYNFTFEELKDEDYFGVKFRHCLINGIPMKIKREDGCYIKFDLEGLVKNEMTEIIQTVTDGKKTSGPEFHSVLEVVLYFEKNLIKLKANPKLKPMIKTGLFESLLSFSSFDYRAK